MDNAGHDAPDFKLHVLQNFERLVSLIVGHEEEFAVALRDAFDGQFAVDNRDDDVSVLRFERAVNDEDVAGMNPRADHRIARDAHEEGGRRMFDEVAIEIESSLYVVLCGRRETCGD